MKSLLPCVLLSLFLAHFSSGVFAADDPFGIEISVQAETQQRGARGRSTSAAPATRTARPVLTVKTKTKLRVRWSVVNQEKTGSIRDVTVHVVLDKEDALGQPGVPKPGPGAVYESALMTDFAAQGKSTGDFVVEAPEPGNYLLRVETIGAVKARRDEYFAAMDLKVVP